MQHTYPETVRTSEGSPRIAIDERNEAIIENDTGIHPEN